MQSTDLAIHNKLGLHARPAANFVQLAQSFACELVLVKADKRANAKSILSIMTLDIRQYDRVTLEANGADEGEAIAALTALAGGNFGDAE
jgi:phosphotransferase system HPr (HPr) family protein